MVLVNYKAVQSLRMSETFAIIQNKKFYKKLNFIGFIGRLKKYVKNNF